jgi:hypothetical protein
VITSNTASALFQASVTNAKDPEVLEGEKASPFFTSATSIQSSNDWPNVGWTVSQSSFQGVDEGWKAFDDDLTNVWAPGGNTFVSNASGATGNQWAALTYPYPVQLRRIVFRMSSRLHLVEYLFGTLALAGKSRIYPPERVEHPRRRARGALGHVLWFGVIASVERCVLLLTPAVVRVEAGNECRPVASVRLEEPLHVLLIFKGGVDLDVSLLIVFRLGPISRAHELGRHVCDEHPACETPSSGLKLNRLFVSSTKRPLNLVSISWPYFLEQLIETPLPPLRSL